MPTLRAIIQKGILIKERLMIEEMTSKKNILVGELVKEVAPLVLAQWQKSNAKFVPPVTITEKRLRQKLEMLWRRVEEVAQGKGKGGRKEEKEKVADLLDKLLDITTCPHTILLCNEEGDDKHGKLQWGAPRTRTGRTRSRLWGWAMMAGGTVTPVPWWKTVMARRR